MINKHLKVVVGTLVVLPLLSVALMNGTAIFKNTSLTQVTNSAASTPTVVTRVASFSATLVANQDGTNMDLNPKNPWFGTGKSVSSSYFGIRYENVSIPAGATLSDAYISVAPNNKQYISQQSVIYGEKSSAPVKWSRQNLISTRTGTTAQVGYQDNVQWLPNNYYTMPSILSVANELAINSSPKTIQLIVKGTSAQSYARKFLVSNAESPKLNIKYTITVAGTTTPTPVATTTATASPTIVPRTSATPTATPATTPTTSGAGGATGTDSTALSAWGINGKNKPNPAYDYCVYGTDLTNKSQRVGMNGLATDDTDASTYVTEAHKRFKVLAPDGKWYPTWHKPVETFTDAAGKTVTCAFGHEHGRDPKGSELWNTKQIQTYFYFDANKNGIMDASEEAVTGLPFGYVNEQYTTYNQTLGLAVMRHEDHVGHKVEYANGEGDVSTHQANNLTTGGVYVGKLGDGVMANDTGVRCYYLAKPHQGVSSGDAFTNNLHEVFYFADCRHSNSAYNQKISTAMLEGFGKPGGFTKFMPMCGVERRSAAQDFIFLGLDAMNSSYPSGDGDREIITRDCIEKGFLVPDGSWSGNLYEAWPASLNVVDKSGRQVAGGINLLFDVEDANRYYYPEDLKAQRGYNNPDAPTNVGYTMDLCYDTSLLSQGRKYRGGPCDAATNYGSIQGIKWNSPKSAFKGVHRGMYFMPATIQNANGPEYWYTDPYGKNAQTTPFPGSIKQQITAKNLNYSSLIGGLSLDPRVIDRVHSNGNGTVHAPN